MQAPVGATQSSGHSLPGTGAEGDGKANGSQGPSAELGHGGREGLRLHCPDSGAAELTALKVPTTDTRVGSPLTEAE